MGDKFGIRPGAQHPIVGADSDIVLPDAQHPIVGADSDIFLPDDLQSKKASTFLNPTASVTKPVISNSELKELFGPDPSSSGLTPDEHKFLFGSDEDLKKLVGNDPQKLAEAKTTRERAKQALGTAKKAIVKGTKTTGEALLQARDRSDDVAGLTGLGALGGHETSVDIVGKSLEAAGLAAEVANSAVGGVGLALSVVGTVTSGKNTVEGLDKLYDIQATQKKFENSGDKVVSLEDGELDALLRDTTNDFLRPDQAMAQTLAFAEGKAQTRIARDTASAFGNSLQVAGGTMALAGAAIGGFGAIPGAIVGGVGTAINVGVMLQKGFRNLVKKYNGTLGKDRDTASKLIHGFALRAAIRNDSSGAMRIAVEDRKNGPAYEALQLADKWAQEYEKTPQGRLAVLRAEKMGSDYVQRLGLEAQPKAGTPVAIGQHIMDDAMGEAIFRDLGSVS